MKQQNNTHLLIPCKHKNKQKIKQNKQIYTVKWKLNPVSSPPIGV